MKRQTVIYYGSRGLVTQVFEKFACAMFHRLVFVDWEEELVAALEREPDAAVILATAAPPDLLLDLARTIQAYGNPQIFILADEPFEVDLPATEVLPRTLGLSAILKRV